MSTTVTLRVPDGREGCVAWLVRQTPELVADYLEASERYHSAVAGAVWDGGRDAVRERLTLENERLHAEAQESERRHVERAQQLREQFESRSAEALDECNAAARAMYARQIDDLNEQVARLRESLAAQKNGEQAQILAATRDVEGRLMGRLDDHARERTRLEERNEQLRLECMRLCETHAANLERFIPRATSSELGAMGERMVEDWHRTLELGTMVNVSKCRDKGYADHTWRHNGAETLVEEKYAKELKEEDYAKFREDVRVAALSGRIDMAMFVSLRRRVAGRPIFSLELLSGVPTLWASRDPTDPLSEETMVTTAFKIMAELWPLVRRERTDGEVGTAGATLRRVSLFLTSQLQAHEHAQNLVRSLEATCQKLTRQVTLLKRQNERLITGVHDVRMWDARLDEPSAEGDADGDVEVELTPEFWETPEGQALDRAVGDFHETHAGRYPKNAAQLASLDAGARAPSPRCAGRSPRPSTGGSGARCRRARRNAAPWARRRRRRPSRRRRRRTVGRQSDRRGAPTRRTASAFFSCA